MSQEVNSEFARSLSNFQSRLTEIFLTAGVDWTSLSTAPALPPYAVPPTAEQHQQAVATGVGWTSLSTAPALPPYAVPPTAEQHQQAVATGREQQTVFSITGIDQRGTPAPGVLPTPVPAVLPAQPLPLSAILENYNSTQSAPTAQSNSALAALQAHYRQSLTSPPSILSIPSPSQPVAQLPTRRQIQADSAALQSQRTRGGLGR